MRLCGVLTSYVAEALDTPFLLLPFRPDSDAGGARTFIRNYYKGNSEGSHQYRGAGLQQELRLTEPNVLCSIMKWCWSRMVGGVVSWPVYEGFQIGERDSNMARHAFETFIPIGAGSEARRSIIFDFFDLLSAVAAHGKMNGLGGRKLSRLAGWWAFEHSDNDKGFEGGYQSWAKAADAASHLFFAYLRTLSPEADPSMSLIERIPRSLQALLGSTEYPPETPTLLQRSTPRVVMLVDAVSPTPFALLRRAKHFEYRDKDRVLREFSEFEDPVDALTDECKRVLQAISSINSAQPLSRQGERKTGQESWSAFQNLGFSDLDERVMSPSSPDELNGNVSSLGSGPRTLPRPRNVDHARPTTPSWGDFLSSGFADDDITKAPPALSLPSDNVLPFIGSRAQTSHNSTSDENLAPGELAAVTNVELDDAFWWVWMTSLAGEEPSDRKAVFGRCALIETNIMNGRWLIMEEQVKGASPDPVDAYEFVAPKKSIFNFTKRGRNKRTKSEKANPESPPQLERITSATPSKTSLAPDQHSKIRAAAAALARKNTDDENQSTARRGRMDDAASTKTSSMMTMGVMNEATPAMKWANAYDKNNLRAQYLGDSFAGRGVSRKDTSRTSSINLIGDRTSSIAPSAPVLSPESSAFPTDAPAESALPAPPPDEPAFVGAEPPAPIEEPSSLSQAGVSPELSSPPPAIHILSEEPEVVEEQHTTEDVSPLEPSQPEPTSAFDKETAVRVPEIPQSRVERKPVPRSKNLQDHPAFRRKMPSESAAAPANSTVIPAEPSPQSPTNKPAAVAAQRAMDVPSSSPESVTKQGKLKKQGGGGFKKLFGRKKDSPKSNSIEAPPQGLAPPSETSLGRRLSLMRKKSTRSTPNSSRVAVDPPAPQVVNEPTMPDSPSRYEQSANNVSRVNTKSDADPQDEFSRFDQGPMHDMPIAQPRESEEDVPASYSPPQPQRTFNTQFASRIAPDEIQREADSGAFIVTPEDRPDPISDVQSEASMENPHPIEPEKDRWAQIRENAAKRVGRASEEYSMQSRPSHAGQSMRETDDGETSGEESKLAPFPFPSFPLLFLPFPFPSLVSFFSFEDIAADCYFSNSNRIPRRSHQSPRC